MGKEVQMNQDEYNKMINEKLYRANDDFLILLRTKARDLCFNFNNSNDKLKRNQIIKELIPKQGEKCTIHQNFYCDYGCNITLGNHVFINYNCLLLDVAEIVVGDNVMLAPNVAIYTATHPTNYKVRNLGLEYGKKVVIKDNVWIGGGAIINPGITIHENAIIASGAVVTKDVEANWIVGGNPAKKIREISSLEMQNWEDLAAEYK